MYIHVHSRGRHIYTCTYMYIHVHSRGRRESGGLLPTHAPSAAEVAQLRKMIQVRLGLEVEVRVQARVSAQVLTH